MGSRVDAVRVHSERLVTLELRGPAGDATLLLSAEPDLTRLHAATWRPPSHPEPLAFQVALRREISGARLASIEAPGGDRLVALRFERPAGPVSLLAELTGRNGNLFLVDGAGVVRAMAGRNLSQRRALLPGAPYLPAGGAGGGRRGAPLRAGGGRAVSRLRRGRGLLPEARGGARPLGRTPPPARAAARGGGPVAPGAREARRRGGARARRPRPTGAPPTSSSRTSTRSRAEPGRSPSPSGPRTAPSR